MEDIKFTKDHYYIIIENDLATVGLTDYLLDRINEEITIIDLPNVNSLYNKNDQIGNIVYEGGNFDLYTPLTGEIAEINENLISEPSTIQHSTYNENWLYRIYINDLDELNELLTEEEYNEYLETI